MTKIERRNSKFNFWLKNSVNVLLLGLSGVGKTMMILERLQAEGLILGDTAAYFSTPNNTFVGDLKTAKVILFDNLNDPNAWKVAKELISFRAYQGTKINGAIWGCYTTTTENLIFDSLDFFDVTVEIPDEPNVEYFVEKYGKDLADSSLAWYEDLRSKDTNYRVSPRRLDIALNMFVMKGDMRDVLPVHCNVSKLMLEIIGKPTCQKFNDFYVKRDDPGTDGKIVEFFENANLAATARSLKDHNDFSRDQKVYFLPYFPSSVIVEFMENDTWYNAAAQILRRREAVALTKLTEKEIEKMYPGTHPGYKKRIAQEQKIKNIFVEILESQSPGIVYNKILKSIKNNEIILEG